MFVGPRRTDAFGGWIREVRVLDWDDVWWSAHIAEGWVWRRMRVRELKLLEPVT